MTAKNRHLATSYVPQDVPSWQPTWKKLTYNRQFSCPLISLWQWHETGMGASEKTTPQGLLRQEQQIPLIPTAVIRTKEEHAHFFFWEKQRELIKTRAINGLGMPPSQWSLRTDENQASRQTPGTEFSLSCLTSLWLPLLLESMNPRLELRHSVSS